MLQLDGSPGNPCTCFLFMKPTETVKTLLVLWMGSIVEASANGWYEDQASADDMHLVCASGHLHC